MGVHLLDRHPARFQQADGAAIAGCGDPDRAQDVDFFHHHQIRNKAFHGFEAFHARQHHAAAGSDHGQRIHHRLGGVGRDIHHHVGAAAVGQLLYPVHGVFVSTSIV